MRFSSKGITNVKTNEYNIGIKTEGLERSGERNSSVITLGRVATVNSSQSSPATSLLPPTLAAQLQQTAKPSSSSSPTSTPTTRSTKPNLQRDKLLLRDSPYFEDPKLKAKQLKKLRKQDIQKRFTDPPVASNVKNANHAGSKYDSDTKTSCHMTFVFDPNGRLSYWMGFVVSLAFLYNFWVMIYRYSFNEINSKNKAYWFAFDYFADFLYICDILFNFRTGFLEEGVLQTDPIRLRHHYMNTTRFYVDCLCLMPLDILYLSIGYYSIFRCFRLVKIYRFWAFLDRTERHTNFPNVFRSVVMLHYLFAIFHWNACFSYLLSRYLSDDLMFKTHQMPLSNSNSLYGANVLMNNLIHSKSDDRFRYKTNTAELNDYDLLKEYLKAFYLSTRIMTLVGEMPNPKTSSDYLFAIVQLIAALLLFATIMGHVGYIVSNLGNARKDFQSKLDAVKTYMSIRRVPQRLQDRVIRWFDFLWTNHKSIDDNQILNLLPYKLRAEIAIHVHLDTLKRVEIFQNTEAGFLNELVLRLKPVLYSPGDFICRKGEVGKEMYIVNGGKLQVISDDGKIVLATLKAGSYFGEISILNMGASGNRRTASVKSVGYSDLFCLSKEDLWEVLKEYPAVRVKLEAIAIKRLEKHKKPLSEIVQLKRCKSSPGLIEASTNLSLANRELKRYGTLPISLLKRTDISLIIASANTNTHSPKPSIKTSKKADKSKHSSTRSSLTSGGTQSSPTPQVVKIVNEETSSCKNNEKKTTIQSSTVNNNSPLNNNLKQKNLAEDKKSQPIENTSMMMQEIEHLKSYIYFLEAENSSLNLRIENPSKLTQRIKPQQQQQTQQQPNSDLQYPQTKCDARHLHRDQFKV